ncbi:translation initiation factor if-3 [Phtheirospermum japonicum]|uniref:Translation initiation factor if-3 n=1 Tax=Phtheirospermum japonicum TaxID=374723 RepID=A0A830CJB2_9LAMI|nr:translation initiation factor if-3 [Phtheirospermum japonicum]
MAGLTSTFHNPCKPQLFKPLKTSFQIHRFSFRPITIRYPSISTTISARYGGGGGGGGFRRPKPSDEDEALNISSIKSDTVRLIDEQQKMVGLVTKAQAFQMAEDAELDLVILSPEADPPVVRIMDYNLKCPNIMLREYSKYRYEQQKKKRDQQKKSAASRMDLKELKMGYNIDVHDYTVRLKAAQKFLKDGDKVKIIVNLKGRENEFRNNAVELLRRFQNDVGELAVEEAKSFKDRNMFIVLVPNKTVVQKSQEPPKKKDDPVVNEVPASVN